ncbi:MAG: hypothetical protein AAGA85_05505 [Bacteroidota bacterium]
MTITLLTTQVDDGFSGKLPFHIYPKELHSRSRRDLMDEAYKLCDDAFPDGRYYQLRIIEKKS